MVARKYVEVMSHMIPFHIGYGTGRSSVCVEVSDNCIVSAADFQLTSTLYILIYFSLRPSTLVADASVEQLDKPKLWRTMWNPKTGWKVPQFCAFKSFIRCLMSLMFSSKVPRLRSTPSRQHCQPTWHCTLPMAPIRTMIVTRFNH